MLCEHVNKRLELGVIEALQSELAHHIVLVPKTDDTFQFCVDLWRLNVTTIPDIYPWPRMDDYTTSLEEAQVLIVFNALCEDSKVEIKDKEKYMTTVISYLGFFSYMRISFGLYNAPATF